MAIVLVLLIVIIIFFLTKKKFKILPSSADTLFVKYGKEYGLLEITPTQEIVLESTGIRFVGRDKNNKTIGVYSLKSNKKATIDYERKIIL